MNIVNALIKTTTVYIDEDKMLRCSFCAGRIMAMVDAFHETYYICEDCKKKVILK